MAFRKISTDVKLAAVRLYLQNLLPLETILDVVGFSKRTFYRILKYWDIYGDVEKPKDPLLRKGRKRILIQEDVDYLLELVTFRPDYFLDELLHLTQRNRFISVHFTTILRLLEHAGLSRKKLKVIAQERNEPLRNDFVREMAQYESWQLGFIDETSKNDKTVARRYGRSQQGKRAMMTQKFVRGRRVTAVGLLSVEGMKVCKVIEGSMDRETYLKWLDEVVLPLCSPFPGPLSVLVMDNAKIHHGEEILKLCEDAGVHLLYLPPYSPDLNPIEEAFSKIKHFIRRNDDIFLDLADDDSLLYNMYLAMSIITPDDAQGYIFHSGYD